MDSAIDPQATDLISLKAKLQSAQLPADLHEKLVGQISRLEKTIDSVGYRLEFEKDLQYLQFVLSLPFGHSTPDILDLHRVAQILDHNHYGIQTAKDRILEYLSILILNSRSGTKLKSQILAFVGLVGSGKTSLAYSIAESLGRKIIRIPFGGLGSVAELRGESRIKAEAEPGKVMKFIAQAGANNPVILLDEIDRVATDTRADVMGVLVELLDPEQNSAFVDHYVDFPFDLSNVLFIATANNTANIATAVMDRLEVIEMPAYTDEEKIVIGQRYILPRALADASLTPASVQIEDGVWPTIVRPLGYDAGIRSLQRHIQSLVRKIARKVVEGNSGPYSLTAQNIGEYLQ